MSNQPLLSVQNLALEITQKDKKIIPVKSIDFSVNKKEIFALVGESGSGKSLTALSILRLLPPNIRIQKGSHISLAGQSLLNLTELSMRNIRAKKIGFIFQDPMSSLNPVMSIESQLLEKMAGDKKDALKKIKSLLDYVNINHIEQCLASYPHQLSGGMKQRIMIAMALSKNPELLIADEPTTALDVTTQAQVLKLIKSLKSDLNMSVLLITHDLGVVATCADRVGVMQTGQIVETNHTQLLFSSPQHEYTQRLLAALPENLIQDKQVTSYEANIPLLEVKQLDVAYKNENIVKTVDLTLHQGETLCLVGESGCGKTTLANTILRLLSPTAGEIIFSGDEISQLNKRQMKPLRQSLQMIFQDPFSSMNPRMTIQAILTEGIKALKIMPSKLHEHYIDKLLRQVGLSPEMKYRYPHEFSGGQRQRIAIARALSVKPKLIICDEPTSSLDVSIQAQILQLMKSIQREYKMSYLFITHNIGVVKFMADNVAVMQQGKIVEYGPSEQVLSEPQHPYTQTLLDAVPSIDHLQENISVKPYPKQG